MTDCYCPKGAISCLNCAGPIFSEIVRHLRADGLIFGDRSLHLTVAPNLGVPNPGMGRTLGHTRIELRYSLLGGRQLGATDVNIEPGLQIVRFQAVAAHELGHVWLAVQDLTELDMTTTEGFCELVAYRYLRLLKDSGNEVAAERHRIATNPDPIYGAGFRHVRSVADRIGFQRVCTEWLPAVLTTSARRAPVER